MEKRGWFLKDVTKIVMPDWWVPQLPEPRLPSLEDVYEVIEGVVIVMREEVA